MPISVKYSLEMRLHDGKDQRSQTIAATLAFYHPSGCSLLWKILRVESDRVLAQIPPGADEHMSGATRQRQYGKHEKCSKMSYICPLASSSANPGTG